MALSVWDEIQSRWVLPFQPAFIMIHRATSSPSRPASVAIISSVTSPRFIREDTTWNCRRDSGITTSFIFWGSIGRSCMSHFSYFLSYTSGSARVTRWPKAQVTIYLSPSRYPFPLFLQSSTRASSRPTEGFSARTSVFAISFPHFFVICVLWSVYHRLPGKKSAVVCSQRFLPFSDRKSLIKLSCRFVRYCLYFSIYF